MTKLQAGYLNTHQQLFRLLELELVDHITITTNDCLYGKVSEKTLYDFNKILSKLFYPALSLSYKHVECFDKNNNKIFEISVN